MIWWRSGPASSPDSGALKDEQDSSFTPWTSSTSSDEAGLRWWALRPG